MAEEVNRSIENYHKKRKKKKSWKKVLRFLSCVVVFCTVYALIIPAITQEKKTYCGKEEHIHEDECYAQVMEEESTSVSLICELEEQEPHHHEETCYEKKPVLVCTEETEQVHIHEDGCYEIQAGHAHGEACYDENQVLICTEEEREEVRNLICELPEFEEHVHKDEYYSTENTESVLVCTLEETEGHVHVEECYSEETAEVTPQLTCTKEEDDVHTHGERCYGTWELACEREEHSHEVTCYADGLVEDPVLTDDVTECTKLALIYTDETYEELAEDSTVITLSGMMPGTATVKAYPVEIMDGENVICAYDISIVKADDSLYDIEENGNITVSIEAPVLQEEAQVEEQVLEVCYVPEEGEPEVLESTVTEEGISFEAEHFSVYMVRAVDARAATNVNNLDSLRNAVNSGQSNIVLTGDIVVPSSDGGYMGVNNGNDVTLDLNGYTIDHQGNQQLIQINGGTFTLVDSGNPTNGTNGKVTFTYNVMTSTLINNATGATQETTTEYTVTAKGLIKTGSQPVFVINSGTLRMQGGTLYGGTNRAIMQNNGITELSGGYIVGFNKSVENNSSDGGAVYCNGGILNISSNVVLANNTAYRGGAIFTNYTEINMSGGYIACNQSTHAEGSRESGDHYGGGGIYVNGNEMTMSGGYITLNTVASNTYYDGGGGVLVAGEASFTMSGGYVTGNSASGGGGIRTNWCSSETFRMTGGYVCSNTARICEGGGICINIYAKGWITGGYINNNITQTQEDWGGGGVFCADKATLYVRRALVVNNHADGFGGGVAGCSTGRVYICVNEGGAIFDNSADGTSLSGDESDKNEDHIYAENNSVFKTNGYQDYFCALSSVVEPKMLGGSYANWLGSVDGVAISNADNKETLIAAYIMGLTAHPDEAGKQDAQTSASVFINGNTSGTHGGGILCNGYMIIGDTNKIKVGARIALKATKQLLDHSGEVTALQDGQFSFSVVDASSKAVIATQTNDATGAIEFSERLAFTGAGTYVYEITETPGNNFDIAYDSVKYRLTVLVGEETQSFDEQISIIRCQIKNVTVERYNADTDQWDVVSNRAYSSVADDKALEVDLTNGPSFTNVLRDKIKINVKKVWEDDGAADRPTSVTVQLYCNGEVVSDSDKVLNASNNWSAAWDELPLSGIVNGETVQYVYDVKEVSIPGYIADYEIINDNKVTGVWIPATSIEEGERYILVDKNLNYVFKVSDLNNVDGALGSADKKALTDGDKTAITIDGQNYSNAILDTAIDKSSELALDHNSAFNNPRTLFQLLGVNGNSWLLAQGDSRFKACSNSDYASRVTLRDNIVWMQWEWESDNDDHVVVYENGAFTTAPNSDSARRNAVCLYRHVSTGLSSDTTVKITNRSTGDLRFALDITKVSEANADLVLKDAHFNLLNAETEEALYFVMGESGNYTFAQASVEGATQDLVTEERGKLILNSIPGGIYILRETQAPANYMPIEDLRITLGEVGSDGTIQLTQQMTIADSEESYALPETGGIGTTIFYIVGAAMVIGVVVVAVTRRRMDDKDEE